MPGGEAHKRHKTGENCGVSFPSRTILSMRWLLRCFQLIISLAVESAAIAPQFAWDTVGHMSFFHACNESGLWSEEALDVIQKFQIVTVEKGQGFNDPSGNGTQAEAHIIAQLAAVKARDATIQTVFYMNSGKCCCCARRTPADAAPSVLTSGTAPRRRRTPASAQLVLL